MLKLNSLREIREIKTSYFKDKSLKMLNFKKK